MSVLDRDLERGGLRWSTYERVQALKRIATKRSISIALGRAGRGKSHCRRLSRPFMVWFVIAMGLFCRDSCQQAVDLGFQNDRHLSCAPSYASAAASVSCREP
jgi:Insertion element 4 transposase N-terminal